MSAAKQFDETYYENGVAAGVSGYTDYRWRPEYVLPLANEIKRRYITPIKDANTVLDYGCAKGFLVKAFRLLGVEAFGFDISSYATANCEPEVRQFVSCVAPEPAGVVVSKDTLEHVAYADIDGVLARLYELTIRTGIVTVPLGDNNLYRIREYELDRTHVIRQDEVWWIEHFRAAGFTIEEFYYDFPGAKEHWVKQHPYGNGTFILGAL